MTRSAPDGFIAVLFSPFREPNEQAGCHSRRPEQPASNPHIVAETYSRGSLFPFPRPCDDTRVSTRVKAAAFRPVVRRRSAHALAGHRDLRRATGGACPVDGRRNMAELGIRRLAIRAFHGCSLRPGWDSRSWSSPGAAPGRRWSSAVRSAMRGQEPLATPRRSPSRSWTAPKCLMAAEVLRRWPGFHAGLVRLGDGFAVVVAVAVAALVGASLGTLAVMLAGAPLWPTPWRGFLTGMVGDGMGVLLVAPPVLAWSRYRWSAMPPPAQAGRNRRPVPRARRGRHRRVFRGRARRRPFAARVPAVPGRDLGRHAFRRARRDGGDTPHVRRRARRPRARRAAGHGGAVRARDPAHPGLARLRRRDGAARRRGHIERDETMRALGESEQRATGAVRAGARRDLHPRRRDARRRTRARRQPGGRGPARRAPERAPGAPHLSTSTPNHRPTPIVAALDGI